MKQMIFTLSLLVATAFCALAQEVEMTTYTYTHKDDVALCMDVYRVASAEEQPCLIYIFGGAFLAGSRAEEEVIEVYDYFARRGWTVVAIDYRLGLLPLLEEPDARRSLLDFRAMLLDAIRMATEDLLDATAFVVTNAKQLNINPNQIVTLGSSAGAIAACQAEWAICNSRPEAAVLPPSFNYAGVISMAGAICAPSRRLQWAKEACPMMLFHGNADRNVPYDRQSLFGVSLFGSEAIAESLQERGWSYWFYDADNMDHNLSWRPMYFLREEIERFAERMVFGSERLQIRQIVSDLSLPECDHDFGLRDYIEANFAPGKPHGVDAATY